MHGDPGDLNGPRSSHGPYDLDATGTARATGLRIPGPAKAGKLGSGGLSFPEAAPIQEAEGAPWQRLYFLPDPQGQGAFRAGSLPIA